MDMDKIGEAIEHMSDEQKEKMEDIKQQFLNLMMIGIKGINTTSFKAKIIDGFRITIPSVERELLDSHIGDIVDIKINIIRRSNVEKQKDKIFSNIQTKKSEKSWPPYPSEEEFFMEKSVPRDPFKHHKYIPLPLVLTDNGKIPDFSNMSESIKRFGLRLSTLKEYKGYKPYMVFYDGWNYYYIHCKECYNDYLARRFERYYNIIDVPGKSYKANANVPQCSKCKKDGTIPWKELIIEFTKHINDKKSVKLKEDEKEPAKKKKDNIATKFPVDDNVIAMEDFPNCIREHSIGNDIPLDEMEKLIQDYAYTYGTKAAEEIRNEWLKDYARKYGANAASIAFQKMSPSFLKPSFLKIKVPPKLSPEAISSIQKEDNTKLSGEEYAKKFPVDCDLSIIQNTIDSFIRSKEASPKYYEQKAFATHFRDAWLDMYEEKFGKTAREEATEKLSSPIEKRDVIITEKHLLSKSLPDEFHSIPADTIAAMKKEKAEELSIINIGAKKEARK